jgi:hypothetical protein
MRAIKVIAARKGTRIYEVADEILITALTDNAKNKGRAK